VGGVADPSLLFSALPFPAFAVSAECEVLAWNRAAERAYGWLGADAIGRPPPGFASDLGALRAGVARVLASRRGEVLELALTDRSGAVRPVRLRAAPFGEPRTGVILVDAASAPSADAAPDGGRPSSLQTVLDAIPAPIFIKDLAGAYIGCNVEFERYLGMSRDQLVGKTVFDVAPPDLAPVYRAADDALFRSGGSQIYESRVQWADGTRRDVVFHKAAIRDEAGRVKGLAGAMLDVTDQRAAQRALRDRLVQQAALTTIATQVLNEEDPRRLGEAALLLTVGAQGAAVGSVLEIAQEGGKAVVRRAAGTGPASTIPLEDDPLARRLVETGGPLVTADGAGAGLPMPDELAPSTTFSVAAVLVGAREAPRGVLAVFDRPTRKFNEDDVQALETVAHVLAVGLGRRYALEAARSTETSFRQLVESLPDLVLIHEAGRIVYVNPAMIAVLGRPLDEVVGSSATDCVHPDDRDSLAPYLHSDFAMPPRELRIRAGEGRWIKAEFLAIAIEMWGRRVRVAFGRDLTERTDAQERLARAHRLAAIGTLAAGVAHELNNPLTFVLSNVELVANALRRLRGAPADADGWDEALHALDDALEGAERMRVIVRDLRTMARSDETSAAPVDVRKLLEYAAHLAWNDVRARARLTWDIGDVPPVRGSETRLGQVFVNLIVNAAHAIPEGNRDAHAIRLSARRQPDGKVAISVSDTGAGIPPEHVSRIFDPFFTTKPVGLGTGLGLWVCHNIVSAFGGTLDVSSEVGQGTTFRVVLSAAEPADASRARRAQDGRDGRARRRLLVVDDEPLVAATVRRQLASDFVVDAASGSADALARIASDRYDAIVCDVVMEGPDGLQFLDALRRKAPALARRVLFVTGGASTGTADLLAASGVPWITKPFDGRQLRQALRELLAASASAA
jgi:PAS domain S-box-containing protein